MRIAADARSNLTTSVYVGLLDEGVPAWRPVRAEHVSGEMYRMIGEIPEGETWWFALGDMVKCEIRMLSGDDTSLGRIRGRNLIRMAPLLEAANS